jgi:hypothetical protein
VKAFALVVNNENCLVLKSEQCYAIYNTRASANKAVRKVDLDQYPDVQIMEVSVETEE